jgi:hypothetical protein
MNYNQNPNKINVTHNLKKCANKNCKYTGIKTDTDRLINDFRIKLLPLIRQYKQYKSDRTIKEIQVMAENYRQSYKKILDSTEYNEYIKCIILNCNYEYSLIINPLKTTLTELQKNISNDDDIIKILMIYTLEETLKKVKKIEYATKVKK